MKHNHKNLQTILQPFIDAEEGDTGDYPEIDEVLRDVVEWNVNSTRELQQLKQKWETRNEMVSSNDVAILLGSILGTIKVEVIMPNEALGENQQ